MTGTQHRRTAWKLRASRYLVLVLLCSPPAAGATSWHLAPRVYLQAEVSAEIHVTVRDPAGNALTGAKVTLLQAGKTLSAQSTSASGDVSFAHLAPGNYEVTAAESGFYSSRPAQVTVASGTFALEFSLQPLMKATEQVEVTAQPAIDVQQSSASHSIGEADINNIPYVNTRDYRNVLAYIPGVVTDSAGQAHISGASTQESQDYIDGFEISQPAGGGLELRLNPESLKKINVATTRYSARFGKGSGGLGDLEVQDGDNKLRYGATDFIPTFQNVKGFHFNNWTPRVRLTGPLITNRAWFNLSQEGEDDLSIIRELPDNADKSRAWRTADLARIKLNLAQGNVVTASGILNLLKVQNAGLSQFDPLSTTTKDYSQLYFLSVKDQISVGRSSLWEFGFASQRTHSTVQPKGTDPNIFIPEGVRGNFYLTSDGRSQRNQGFTNFYLHPLKGIGTHQVTFGGELDRITYDQFFLRNTMLFQDENGGLLRQATFQNVPSLHLSTVESSAYLQDRWAPAERFFIEAGTRWDHDSFIQRGFVSPRGAVVWVLQGASETKLSAGAGIYYDRTNLSLASEPLQGSRTDQFFTPGAASPLAVQTSFVANPSQLHMPRFFNWSVGLERRLPGNIYANVQYQRRHGTGVWAYEQQPNGVFLLQTRKEDRYDGVELTLRHDLKPGYPLLVSYTYSSSRSNETLSYSVDNPIFGPQVGGPLPWDAPNHVISWGLIPLPWKLRKFDLAYSVNWRTGFPFVTTNDLQQLVDGPAAHRFPDYFILNPAIERQVIFKGYRWGLRIGIDNITNSENPVLVNADVNSPTFLQFEGLSHRTLNGRIRFLGRK